MRANHVLSGQDWSPGRRAAACVFATLGLALLSALAVYVSGVLFLVFNKANPAQAHWWGITHYWRRYSDDPPLRRKLYAAMGVSGVGLVIVLPMALLLADRPRRAPCTAMRAWLIRPRSGNPAC